MKTIGLIGGTGWISTIEYYRLINQETNRLRGGQSTARIAVWSVDFGEIHALHAKGEFERVGAIVTDAARKLERIGAECLLLCANTTHMHAEAIRAAVSVPLIHIVEATAERLRASGLKRVGLLGTRITMEHEFYRSKLAEAGIGVLVPGEGDRAFIQRTIDEELMKSALVNGSRQRFVEIIRTFAAEGAEGVVLGCTEIPLLVKEEDSPLPAFDTTRIHALAAVEFALQSCRRALPSKTRQGDG